MFFHKYKYFFQALQFPVVATFSGEAFKLLTSALQAKTTPILMVRPIRYYIGEVNRRNIDFLCIISLFQYLGYLDLYLLSIHSAQRRKKIYSLDQSGQPKVWNVVHTECLSLINSMTMQLSNKKLTNGIAGSGVAASDIGGVNGDQISQNQSEYHMTENLSIVIMGRGFEVFVLGSMLSVRKE